MTTQKPNILKIIKLAYYYSWPYLLSHHPICEPYRNDVFKIRNVFICKGCATTYPPFVLGLLIGLIVNNNWFKFLISQYSLIVIGAWSLVVLLFFVIKKYLFRSIKFKYFVRIVIFFITGILLAVYILLGYYKSILLAYLISQLVIIVIVRKRIEDFEEKCITCPQLFLRKDYQCTGLKPFGELFRAIKDEEKKIHD